MSGPFVCSGPSSCLIIVVFCVHVCCKFMPSISRPVFGSCGSDAFFLSFCFIFYFWVVLAVEPWAFALSYILQRQRLMTRLGWNWLSSCHSHPECCDFRCLHTFLRNECWCFLVPPARQWLPGLSPLAQLSLSG